MENQNPPPPISEASNTNTIVPEPQNPNSIKPAEKIFTKLIIGIVAFLILVGSTAASYVYKNQIVSMVSKPTPTPTSTASPITTVTPTMSKLRITDLMTFDIPEGWKGEYVEHQEVKGQTTPSPLYKITSPDLIDNPLLLAQKTPSVSITIHESPAGNTDTFDEKFDEITKLINDSRTETNHFGLYKTTIGRQPAYSLFQEMEGYRHYFKVKNASRWWDIIIGSVDKTQQKLHEDEIEKFIKSIRFVEKETIDTSNWKTYIDINNDYSLKYPSDKFARKLCSNEELVLQQKINGIEDDKVASICARDGRFDLEVITLKEPFAEPITNENFSVTKSNVTVAGISAWKYVSTPKRDDCPCYWSTSVKLSNNGKNYLIHFGLKDKTELLDQILSTFKFTDQELPPGGQYSSKGQSCGPNAGPAGDARCAPGLTCKYNTPQEQTNGIGTCVE